MKRKWLLGLSIVFLVCVCQSVRADSDALYKQGLAAYQREDLVTAMGLLQQAVDGGHSKAMVLMAYIYDKSEEDQLALDLYRRAADLGDPAGELGLAEFYATGESVERDQAKALQLIQQAADKGYPPAMLLLAQYYDQGEMGLEKDPSLSSMWLNKAADAGYPEAQMERKKRLERKAGSE